MLTFVLRYWRFLKQSSSHSSWSLVGTIFFVTMNIWRTTHNLGWVVLSGKTRVKDPHLNFHHAFVGSSNSSNDVCTSRFLVRMARWHSPSMQPRCSRSYSPILDGKMWIMSSMMSRTQCERLRSPDRLDLESRPYCTSSLTYHTLRTWTFLISQWLFSNLTQLQRIFKEGHS
jgi:hypothetical protein